MYLDELNILIVDTKPLNLGLKIMPPWSNYVGTITHVKLSKGL